MKVVHTFVEVREHGDRVVGLVPTMGYLHEGHVSVIAAAAARTETVVVSLFVNPLQFDGVIDLETYPADLERDASIAAEAGADILFAPSLDEMYPEPQLTIVHVDEVGAAMEGERRPGHFDGVATVVAKLFSGIRPDMAFFGRKDAQQLAVVTTLARQLSMPIEIVGLPTVREADGVALGSRNTRLDPPSRISARRLAEGLFAAAEQFTSGERSSGTLTAIVRDTLGQDTSISIDYVEVADATSAAIVEEVKGEVFLAVAARIGGVRLIDNIYLDGRTGLTDTGSMLRNDSILYESGSCS
ncbi:MAG: pantoate--beta-alanine ligase [Proteobacteria bacterium]|nr:pantoate--beta-alanine ligase [Pseudomonadota bacterium]